MGARAEDTFRSALQLDATDWQISCLRLVSDIGRFNSMASQVRVVKKPKGDASMRVATNGDGKNERQRNREMVGVIKRWVEEFKLRSQSGPGATLALPNE